MNVFCRVILVLVALTASSAMAQTEGKDDDAARKLQAMVEEAVAWYEFFPDAESTTPMKPVVALRWRNASRGQTAEDLMVLWIHAGRPQAVASVYPWNGAMCHELASVSRKGTLVARDKGAVVWSPVQPGGPFQDVSAGPVPAETAAGRLRQMKTIAQQFTVIMTGWKSDDSDREELRMLPRPLYRYDMKEAAPVHAGLMDGAVFGFVQGTDPEAVLVIEAVRHADQVRWQFAFARATSGGVEAHREEKLVWKAEKNGALSASPVTHPQIVLRRVLSQ